MRLRSTAAAVFAAVPLALAGCSQSGDQQPQSAPQPPQAAQPSQPAQQPAQPGQPPQQPAAQQPAPQQPAPQPPPAKPETVAWAGKLCAGVGGFAASQQQSPQVDKSNPQNFKASSVAQMTAAERSADESLHGLQNLGPAPVPGADHVAQTFVGGFQQVHDVLDGARTKAEGVDTSNEQAFTAGMTGVQQELRKGQGINFDAQFAEFDKNAELRNAAGYSPQCQVLMKAPQPGQQQAPQQPGQ